MPFKKVDKDDFVSPSGRHFNKSQVKLYYANDGFQRKHKRDKCRGMGKAKRGGKK